MHALGQTAFDGYWALGVRVFSITNYYPSAPTPLSTFTVPDPSAAAEVPAAEYHSVIGLTAATHLVGLGSNLVVEDGMDMGWPAAVDAILDELRWPDAGGVVIPHPIWSGLTVQDVKRLLDHDPRVLGIEAMNALVETNPDYAPERRASAIPMWDEVLQSGRRCWGFFTTDHYYAPGTHGRTVLLLPELTGEAAARAWRRGEFYGALNGAGLTLLGVDVADRLVTVHTDAADEIRMVCAGQVVATEPGPVATFTVPADAVYARFEAENEADTIWTQPVMYALT